MTQPIRTPDASLVQVLTDARARLDAANELTPEQVSQCNAFVDIIREEIIEKIAAAQVQTVQLHRGSHNYVQVPAIVAYFNSRHSKDKLISDGMTVDRFCNNGMSDTLVHAVASAISDFEQELSQVLGTPGRDFQCVWGLLKRPDGFTFECVIPQSPMSKDEDLIRY